MLGIAQENRFYDALMRHRNLEDVLLSILEYQQETSPLTNEFI